MVTSLSNICSKVIPCGLLDRKNYATGRLLCSRQHEPKFETCLTSLQRLHTSVFAHWHLFVLKYQRHLLWIGPAILHWEWWWSQQYRLKRNFVAGPGNESDAKVVHHEAYFHANAYLRLDISQTPGPSSYHRQDRASELPASPFSPSVHALILHCSINSIELLQLLSQLFTHALERTY